MTKRQAPLIVGNWKATPRTLLDATTFIKKLEQKIARRKEKLPKKLYSIAVPDAFIHPLSVLAKRGLIGGETVHGTTLGQTTGISTPSQLASSGAEFVIIGHSEVRAQGETQEARKEKVLATLGAGLQTVLCFGERTRDKEGVYLEELESDVKETLSAIPREYFNKLVLAYEPIWAIGAKEPARANECFEVVIALRRALASLVGIDHAKKVRVLYGGSVTLETMNSFLQEGGVDGLLIGRASQDVTTFTDILVAAYQ